MTYGVALAFNLPVTTLDTSKYKCCSLKVH